MDISQRSLKSLKPPSEGKALYWDDAIPGFGVSVTSNGAISFIINYRVDRRERRYSIGRYPEWSADAARDEALDLRKRIRKGDDPLASREQERGEPLMSDLARDYIERHAVPYKRPGSIRNDQGLLRNIILPRLQHLRVRAVDRRDIERLHGSLKATPYHANRVLALLSTMFRLAVEWRLRDDNPVKGVRRYHEEHRETWLSLDQLRSLELASRDYPDQNVADALRLLVVTGAREGEILKAEWSQFDLKRGVWTKPSHHTKQKKVEHVPLNRAAWGILSGMHRHREGQYLFPGKNGARVTLRKPWIQVCKSAGLATRYEVPGKMRTLTRYRPTVRVHDLRHTFASHLVSNGESLHIVGRLLGHTNPATTQRYAHLSDKAIRDASNAVNLLQLKGGSS